MEQRKRERGAGRGEGPQKLVGEGRGTTPNWGPSRAYLRFGSRITRAGPWAGVTAASSQAPMKIIPWG